ncbi:hypothetical protein QO002_001793 [Pararhizobium capsulatum DSM 1112]|uniref:Acid stress chaperone HdeA n=1 Tax=Pararhizobium capsulatum DSM 1112 TaxID=1121113 RepID=A0ABU0BQB4_9HYPH|nr:hypothetical protein [Pararhizobium capsulatum]MDQ0319655.1 hypothetical protein [Pararhizobium capsulatum DSM 1112]
MKRIVCVAIFSLLVLPTMANAGQEFAIRGVGNSSCGKYVRDDNLRKFALQWVGGFTTAINQMQAEVSTERTDMLKGADGDAIDVWMMNYCTQNPLKTIREAASELVRQ